MIIIIQLLHTYFFIEFTGHLSPWNCHEIHSLNGGMPHLLFLVAMRAISIYGPRCPFPSISSNGPPSFYKNQKSPSWSLDYNRKHRGDQVCDPTVNVPIIQTIETDQSFSRIRRQLFAFMVGVGLRCFQIPKYPMLVPLDSCPVHSAFVPMCVSAQ